MMSLEDRRHLDNQSRVRSVQLVQVVRVVELRGRGEEHSPAREVVQFYDLDGKWLAENDRFAGTTA
jgi:hypothetical protein